MSEKIIDVKNLSIEYRTKDEGTCYAVNDVSLSIEKGKTLGLIGETGAGKTTIALGILRLLPKPQGHLVNGTINFKGEDLSKLNDAKMRKIRGEKISMIFQDPMTALNPIDTVGDQISEVIWLHDKISRKEAVVKAMDMMELVGIPAQRYNDFPHQFSGGMKQRIVIAIALACSPELLIADEPTTALDVTIQAQVLEMMNQLKNDMGTSMLLITHDLGVVAEMCDDVAIIYSGEIVEMGTARQIYKDPLHPYTQGLFASLPDLASTSNRLKPIRGLMADPTIKYRGCRFAERCDYRMDICDTTPPQLKAVSDDGHMVRCHLMDIDKKGDEI